MGARGAWLLIVALLAACEFPRPANVGPGGDDGGAGDDDGGTTGDGQGSGDGGGMLQLGAFANVAGVTLKTPRSFHGHAIIQNRLTVFGGISDTTLPATNEQATIMANDVIGNFGFTASSLADAGTGMGFAIIGTSSLYALGGEVGSGNTTTEMQQAPLTGGGGFGAFTIKSTTLSLSRSVDGFVVTSKHVYVFGGVHIVPGSTTHLSSVERATINAGDVLSSFTSQSALSLVGPATQFATVVVGNFVYVIGGSDGTNGNLGALDTVQRAPINGDGTIGTFTDTTNHLVTPRLSHAAVVLGDSVYVIGGRGSADSFDTVERAVIQANGSLGPFAILPNVTLATPRYGHTADVVGNSIYVTGGQSDIVTTLDTVERARLQ